MGQALCVEKAEQLGKGRLPREPGALGVGRSVGQVGAGGMVEQAHKVLSK